MKIAFDWMLIMFHMSFYNLQCYITRFVINNIDLLLKSISRHNQKQHFLHKDIVCIYYHVADASKLKKIHKIHY